MSDTKIEWTDKSWNPVTGCSKISEGCQNCYAERMAKRLAGRYGYPKDEPFRVEIYPERLKQPLKWKKPRKIFVCSMGDLYHRDVPAKFRADIMDVIYHTPWHTYLILTKRPLQMKDSMEGAKGRIGFAYEYAIPLPNVWLGVSVENQKTADERIPILLQIPAKVRFISIEPMLEPIHLWKYWFQGPLAARYKGFLDWVILGGESGPRARPMHPDWPRKVRDKCKEAGVPFFFKNMGSAHEPELAGKITAGRLLDGRFWEEYPE